jgi:hypothetical protein
VSYATGKIPGPLNAIATIDRICLAFRTERARDADVWGLAKKFSPDLGA